MKTLAEWLARKPKGPAPKRPLPRVTPKRAKQNREYSVKRKAFLLAHPYDQAIIKMFGQDEASVIANGGFAEMCITPCLSAKAPTFEPLFPGTAIPRSDQIHHTRKPKCKYLNDESTWLAVSVGMHRWIEDNKRDARELGLLF